MVFCPAPSRLELILTITIEDNVAPPAQILSSSLATLAIMMKTRRKGLQRLRSDQKCRSSKIIHSGGKRSPEDLLTRPHCWKDSGPRLLSKNKTFFHTSPISFLCESNKSSTEILPGCRIKDPTPLPIERGRQEWPDGAAFTGEWHENYAEATGAFAYEMLDGYRKVYGEMGNPCKCWFIDGKTVD